VGYHKSQFDSWEEIVSFVQSKPELSDYVFAGIDRLGELRFLHVDHLHSNGHILGGTRYGKTMLVATPLWFQLLRRRNTHIWLLDPKGDDAAFHTAKIECERLGLEFKYFTVESDRATFGYFPLKQESWRKLSLPEKAQQLVMGTGIEYGDVEPGLAYFGILGERLYQEAIRACPNATTFRELFAATEERNAHRRFGMSKRDFENAGAARSHLARLKDIPQLNSGPAGIEASAIAVQAALQTPGVTVIRAPANRVPGIGRASMRLVVSDIVAEARAMGRAPLQQIIVADEFHTLAQRGFVDILKQAVDLNVSTWACHQNLSDLEQGPHSMLDAVKGNVGFRIMLSADELGKKHLQDAGGDRVRWLDSESRSITEHFDGTLSMGWTFSKQQFIDKQVSNDDVLHLNLTSELGTIEAYPSKGLANFRGPTFIQMLHVTTLEEYRRRKALPWPAVTSKTMIGRHNDEPPSSAPAAPPTSPRPRPPEAVPAKPTQEPKAKPAPSRPSVIGELLKAAANNSQ
jgi:hypothetical protein